MKTAARRTRHAALWETADIALIVRSLTVCTLLVVIRLSLDARHVRVSKGCLMTGWGGSPA